MRLNVSNDNWYSVSVSTEMEYLGGFAELTETQIVDLPSIRAKHTEEINLLEGYAEAGYAQDEVLFGVFSSSISHDDLVSKYFPNSIRKSTFVTIWGEFLTILRSVCRIMKNVRNIQIDLKDLNGSELEQVANYLIKVVGIENFKELPLWQELTTINELRNLIVHRNGSLDKVSEKDKTRFVNFGEITIAASTDNLFLESGFTWRIIEKINEFLLRLERMTAQVPG